MTGIETATAAETPQQIGSSMAALAEKIRVLRQERRDRDLNVSQIHSAMAGTGADQGPLHEAQAALKESEKQLTDAVEAYTAAKNALPDAIAAAEAARRLRASPAVFRKPTTTIARRLLRDHQAKLQDLEARTQSAAARRLALQDEIAQAKREAHHAAVQGYMVGDRISIAPSQSIDIDALESELAAVTADAAALRDAWELEANLTRHKQEAATVEAQEEAKSKAFVLFLEMLPAARQLLEQNQKLAELMRASNSTAVPHPFQGPFLDQWVAQVAYFGVL